jgi:prepilin peptidase dependent protein B
MVALVINAFLFAGLITIFIANLEHNRKMIDISRLNEELQATMQIMITEIRRAGYWANAQNDLGSGQNNNPFMASGADITTSGTNCILFSYDHDKSGTLPAIAPSYDDKRYGFRLNGGAIQIRPPGAVFDCGAASNAWENLTDPSTMTITALTFGLNQQSLAVNSSSLLIRSVDITITGRLVSDSTITKSLTAHVRIRNDKFVP